MLVVFVTNHTETTLLWSLSFSVLFSESLNLFYQKKALSGKQYFLVAN